MAIKDLDSLFTSQLAHDEVSANTTEPESLEDPDIFSVGRNNTIRTGITYGGSLSAVALQAWFYQGGIWTKGAVSEGDLALDPAAGSQTLDWTVGRGSRVHFQVTGLTGTGTLTVTVGAVDK